MTEQSKDLTPRTSAPGPIMQRTPDGRGPGAVGPDVPVGEAVRPDGRRFRELKHPRVWFAVLLSIWSIGLAEVALGNEIGGLLAPWMWLLLVPVYGLQVLLISSWVFRANARPTLAALWCAGVIFGLYEFYITGVLWFHADWQPTFLAGEVSWEGIAVIAGFWHPWAAFILPLAIAEQLMVKEPVVAAALPRWLRERGPGGQAVVLVLLVGLVYSLGRHSVWLTAIVVPASAILVWFVSRSLASRPKAAVIRDVLPNRRGLWWIAAVVALVYLVMGSVTLSHGIPGESQLIALACYAFFIGLLALSLRRTNPHPTWRASGRGYGFSRVLAYAVGVFVLGIVLSLVPGLFGVLNITYILLIWIVGGWMLGLWMFSYTLMRLIVPMRARPAGAGADAGAAATGDAPAAADSTPGDTAR